MPAKETTVTKEPTSAETKIVVQTKPRAVSDPIATEQASETKPPAAVPSRSKVKLEPLDANLTSSQSESNEAETTSAEAPLTNDGLDDPAEADTSKRKSDKDKQAAELTDKKAAERAAQLEKIAEAKTYYLPINQVEKRRSKRVAVAGALLIILLGLAWADVALDARLITIPGVKAPTHFFDN